MDVVVRGLAAIVLLSAVNAVAYRKLYAELQVVPTANATVGFFQCTAYENQTYYLNHVMSWSKIGHDGKEKFLSLNWQLVQDAAFPDYTISSNAYKVTNETSNFYFTLIKNDLTVDDHGEYICRLYDFDRNVLAERRIPVSIYRNGLTLEPYVLRSESGKSIAVNCKRNTSDPTFDSSHRVVISHVKKDGNSTRIATDGKLENATLSEKYEIINGTVEDTAQYILTIKAPTVEDNGKVVCTVENDTAEVAKIDVALTVDKPELRINPRYFLKVPTDSYAKFQCACDPRYTSPCDQYQMSWSFIDKYTGAKNDIFRNGTVLESPDIYKVKSGNGTSEFSIDGLVEMVHEGIYKCTLEDSGKVLAEASVPVTVVPVSLGALAITENYPENVRILCTVSGTQWNSHYLETHNLTWTRTRNGTSRQVSANGEMSEGFDKKRYSVYFDPKRYFVILDIKVLTEEDHGDYTCHLKNVAYNKIIKQETLRLYGKGVGTLFAGSYGA